MKDQKDREKRDGMRVGIRCGTRDRTQGGTHEMKDNPVSTQNGQRLLILRGFNTATNTVSMDMRGTRNHPLLKNALGMALAALVMAGCASSRPLPERPVSQLGKASVPEEGSISIVAQGEPTRGQSYSNYSRSKSRSEIVIRGVRLENTNFDYPITINSRVEYWVDYFTGRGRQHFARYLERSELFIPYIVPLLKQNGMPEDLVYLAMIESGFNNHARSWAKAVGPWQFIPATGKRYGLTVNWWVDERRDTHKSTLGAIGYLRDLYSIFNSWELAAAAYNAGEAKIARGIRRYGTKDFWVLSRQRFLRPETRDYVPKIIAAALIAKNRHLFGFAPSSIQPGQDEAISPSGELVKLVKNGDPDAPRPSESSVDPDEELDPDQDSVGLVSITESGISGSEDDPLADYENAPDRAEVAELKGSSEEREAAATNPLPGVLAGAEAVPLAKPIATPKVSKSGELSGEILTEFEVQGPADLLKIARAAGLSYHTVKALNPELLRWCTPPSASTYRIKLPVSVKDVFLAAYNDPSFQRNVQFLTHRARRGETLSMIARRYGIRVDALSEMNRVSPRTPLRTQSVVVLPLPNDRSRTLASLEVLDPPEVRRRSRRVRSSRAKFYKVSYKRRESARSARRGRDRT